MVLGCAAGFDPSAISHEFQSFLDDELAWPLATDH
jgi:hypothetical protein